MVHAYIGKEAPIFDRAIFCHFYENHSIVTFDRVFRRIILPQSRVNLHFILPNRCALEDLAYERYVHSDDSLFALTLLSAPEPKAIAAQLIRKCSKPTIPMHTLLYFISFVHQQKRSYTYSMGALSAIDDLYDYYKNLSRKCCYSDAYLRY